jgi:single-strand DNA-binding protein
MHVVIADHKQIRVVTFQIREEHGMARDLNKVMITGRLGADPEMRYTPQGSPVTTFSVASGRAWRSADGTQHNDTEWFRVVAWEKLAEICNQYLTKGTQVYVEGRLQTRKYQDRDGNDRYSTEVIASDMIMLGSRRDDQGGDAAYGESGAMRGGMGGGNSQPSDVPPAPPRESRLRNQVQSIGSEGVDSEFDTPPPARSRTNPPRRTPPPPMDEEDDLPF